MSPLFVRVPPEFTTAVCRDAGLSLKRNRKVWPVGFSLSPLIKRRMIVPLFLCFEASFILIDIQELFGLYMLQA